MDASDPPIEFCTLGMFIIDEIHFQPPTPPVKDIIGGAGTFSALGARVLSPPPSSRSVGWIVDCGSDFPGPLRDTIGQWDTGCLFRETPERLTTRGWNGYGENEHRAFRYLTPKRRLDHTFLTPRLLRSKSFHLICSPTRCVDLVTGIMARRRAEVGEQARPLFLWEPVPDLCVSSELKTCIDALKYIDLVSPNHAELCAFFGRSGDASGNVDRAAVEECSDAFLQSNVGPEGTGAVVVRAGKEGCYVRTRELTRWMPAFHQSTDKVVDPTGGGNMFLGGLAIGLVREMTGERADLTDAVEAATVCGTVAASFAIEQVGVPVLGREGKSETWNGVRVRDRLDEFRNRLD